MTFEPFRLVPGSMDLTGNGFRIPIGNRVGVKEREEFVTFLNALVMQSHTARVGKEQAQGLLDAAETLLASAKSIQEKKDEFFVHEKLELIAKVRRLADTLYATAPITVERTNTFNTLVETLNQVITEDDS